MTLTFTQADWDELWDSTDQVQPTANGLDDFETLNLLPSCLGSGYIRGFNLAPGLWLSLTDCQYHQDSVVQVPVHDHPIQIGVFLSGMIDAKGAHPTLGGNRAYFSGSGISPGYQECRYAGQHTIVVNVEMEPAWMDAVFGEDMTADLRALLYKGQNWKASFYPKMTPAMRSLSQQIWNAPYRGMAQRMYLQAKVWELLAMQIDFIMADRMATPTRPGLKPDTIARLHHAKELLTQQLEHPPLLSQVAVQVGISDRTLRRGFQELFGMTPLAYLTQQRMQRARYLLQQGKLTVTEVARTVGYGHLGHFSVAFKREFGMTPGACIGRKISVLGS